MTRQEALIDAAMTVLDAAIEAQKTISPWLAEPQWRRDRIRRHVARALGCYPAWSAIKAEIVRRLLAEAEPPPRAA